MSKNPDVGNQSFNPLADAKLTVGSRGELDMVAIADCARFSLRISPSDLKQASKAFELDIPDRVGQMSFDGARSGLCLGPDDWMLMAPIEDADRISAKFLALPTSLLYSLVDLGHRTVGIELFGPMAREVLNAGCPLDLENMAESTCTRTVLDGIEIVLIKRETQHYHIEIVRSFGEFIWKYLSVAAHGQVAVVRAQTEIAD